MAAITEHKKWNKNVAKKLIYIHHQWNESREMKKGQRDRQKTKWKWINFNHRKISSVSTMKLLLIWALNQVEVEIGEKKMLRAMPSHWLQRMHWMTDRSDDAAEERVAVMMILFSMEKWRNFFFFLLLYVVATFVSTLVFPFICSTVQFNWQFSFTRRYRYNCAHIIEMSTLCIISIYSHSPRIHFIYFRILFFFLSFHIFFPLYFFFFLD